MSRDLFPDLRPPRPPSALRSRVLAACREAAGEPRPGALVRLLDSPITLWASVGLIVALTVLLAARTPAAGRPHDRLRFEPGVAAADSFLAGRPQTTSTRASLDEALLLEVMAE